MWHWSLDLELVSGISVEHRIVIISNTLAPLPYLSESRPRWCRMRIRKAFCVRWIHLCWRRPLKCRTLTTLMPRQILTSRDPSRHSGVLPHKSILTKGFREQKPPSSPNGNQTSSGNWKMISTGAILISVNSSSPEPQHLGCQPTPRFSRESSTMYSTTTSNTSSLSCPSKRTARSKTH